MAPPPIYRQIADELRWQIESGIFVGNLTNETTSLVGSVYPYYPDGWYSLCMPAAPNG